MQIPIVGQSYALTDLSYDAQRCVNLFAELSESGSSKTPARLVGTPGLEPYTVAGGGPHRGCLTTEGGRCFFVSGNKLYEISALGVATERGTLNSAITRVSLAANGTQVMMVDGVNGYILTLATNAFVQISDNDFPNGATVCDFQDTYFIVNDPSTGDFMISANGDGFTWAALDRIAVESAPDSLVSLLSDHGELFLFGSSTVEVYYNTGSTPVFTRISQAVMQVGIAAPHARCSFDNNVVWLGEDKEGGRYVYQVSEGYRPVRISNAAVEEALASVVDISRAYIWTYKTVGHEFLMLQVVGLNSTWVFDASTKIWHERTYFNDVTNSEELHLGSCHTFFNGSHLVGDRENGNIYKMKLNYYKDGTKKIHRTRICPVLSQEMDRTEINELVLSMKTGVGNAECEDPQIVLQVSKDLGNTYGAERWKSIGKQGEFRKRVKWDRLGSPRGFVLKFAISEPVEVSIHGLYGT